MVPNFAQSNGKKDSFAAHLDVKVFGKGILRVFGHQKMKIL